MKILTTGFCLLLLLKAIWASCPIEKGGGQCPLNNTCCATSTPGLSSCITHKENTGPGVCCYDDGVGLSGCGPGYKCSTKIENEATVFYCQKISNKPSENAVSDVEALPRYKLCKLSQQSLNLNGLTINSKSSPKLAYYSSHGSIEDESLIKEHNSIKRVIIIVHGSSRNADDYLCCGLSSIPTRMEKTTMVIAPWFLTPEDRPQNDKTDFMRWNESGPIPHTWRYGAESVSDGLTSSYRAMDELAEKIMFQVKRFPLLESLVVAGHSAGGQFTHRWALTSNPETGIWGDYKKGSSDFRFVPLRVVAANPRSFCYLDARRFNNMTFTVPDPKRIKTCPGYNAWEWGLGDLNGRVPGPKYVKDQIHNEGGYEEMVKRYAQRNVIYLAGDLDRLPVRAECEDDDFQGHNRFERSKIYFDYLTDFFGQPTHRRYVAKETPHDHCLIFQSAAGRKALFGEDLELSISLRPRS